MNQKNHSQNNLYLHDLKNTSTVETNNKNEKTYGIFWSIFLLAAIIFVATTIYSKNNIPVAENTITVDEQIELIATNNSEDLDSDLEDELITRTPLDLDHIESLDLIKEPNAIALVDKAAISKPIIHADDSLVVDANRVEPNAGYNWLSLRIKKGDNLSNIFDRFGLSHKDAIAIASTDEMKTLNHLSVGKKLELKIDPEGQLAGIKYNVNKLKTLEIIKNEKGELISKFEEKQPRIRIRDVTAPIDGSLSNTADTLKIPNKAISKLSSIFRWDIDFARDIKEGDRFSLIFEEKYIDGELIETGNILAAEFIINGNITRAIQHIDENGHSQYYTPEGKSLRKAFMRNPIKFAKVTSGFTKRRYHPVLKKWRAHKGVDYGAHKGTPIMATADGIINHLGRKGAYGKAIVLNHGKSYSTLYGHMSRFRKGLKQGARVTQGQIIGYVGSTGLATGPHLHYEFRIDNKHVDPLAVDLPRSLPIDSEELNQFIVKSEKWIRRLDALQGESVVSINTARHPSI